MLKTKVSFIMFMLIIMYMLRFEYKGYLSSNIRGFAPIALGKVPCPNIKILKIIFNMFKLQKLLKDWM